MKKTGLIIGVLLVISAVIGGVYLLLLPMTNNRVGLISAGVVFLAGLLITNASLLFIFKSKRQAFINDYETKLQTEGILLFDGRAGGSVTYRNFHRPGAYSGWRKVGFGGVVALTKTRLLALNGANPVIDVPLTDERLRQMQFSLEDEKTLLIAFDANLFQPEWSGAIEYRFATPQAPEFLQKLSEITR